MMNHKIAHPKIVSVREWTVARESLLAEEKALTRRKDAVNAERRKLPMVKIEKDYVFEGQEGKVGLKALFADRRQLIIYHFMFDPALDDGCMGCTGFVNAIGDLSMLNERDTNFVLVSRAPLPKLEAYGARQGWHIPWYSSFGSEFNADFRATLEEGESQGLSVFFRLENELFHTYSTYGRGVEALTDAYPLLDTTPYGRQEDFEDSPPGWPQKPMYS